MDTAVAEQEEIKLEGRVQDAEAKNDFGERGYARIIDHRSMPAAGIRECWAKIRRNNGNLVLGLASIDSHYAKRTLDLFFRHLPADGNGNNYAFEKGVGKDKDLTLQLSQILGVSSEIAVDVLTETCRSSKSHALEEHADIIPYLFPKSGYKK